MTVDVQAARGDIAFGPGHGFGRASHADFAAPYKGKKVLMDNGLFVVNMHAVVGDEDAGGSAIALGVNELIQSIEGWQGGRATACLRSSFAS